MAAFSRLQLAKALIEYDNDPSNPYSQQRNAEESAIFSHLRRAVPTRQMAQANSAARRSTDYLGVALPTHAASSDSISQYRKSQASIDALRNPFGRDSTHEGPPEEEELEVDLSSWGLDAFGPKDQGSRKMKNKEEPLPNPHLIHQQSARRRPATAARTLSMGNFGEFGEGGAFIDAKSTVPIRSLSTRRHSVASPLDYAEVEATDPSLQRRRRLSEHALIDSIPTTPPLHTVPFPDSNSGYPGEGPSAARPLSRASLLDPAHPRSQSSASVRPPEDGEPNPFAIQPPSPERASRFDPKYMRARTLSNGTLGTQMLLNDVDAEPGREREMPEAASIRAGQPGRDRPYSRIELMRPKVLIMPSPLQGSEAQAQDQEPGITRDGFVINNADGPPLPPGARTRRLSSTMSILEPSSSLSPSGSYGFTLTPNPRASMTLSQLTFRNTLAVDGQRDVAYADIDERLKRATEEGEQVDLNAAEPTGEPQLAATPMVEQSVSPGRPPGRLYGKSLIDDLQARKVEMKAKQRVFRGDDRPSMMARTPMKRSSTLIDPETLKERPNVQQTPMFNQGPDVRQLVRSNSASHRKTLINFDDEIPGAPKGVHLTADHGLGGGMRQAKSVFGVDTLWERELSKLKEIEAREKAEEEERRKREEQEGRGRKKKGKGKFKDKARDTTPNPSSPGPALSPVGTPSPEVTFPQSSDIPPVSPAQKRFIKRPPLLPVGLQGGDDEDEDDGSDSSSIVARRALAKNEDANAWNSDEENAGPRRTTVSGPKYNLPPRLLALQQQGQLQLDDEDDSEEDLPLVATIGRAAQRATQIVVNDDGSSDEDKPLTAILDKRKSTMTLPTLSVGGSVFGHGSNKSPSASGTANGKGDDSEDEDDKPLGLRASRIFPAQDEDEDDKPLALHPEQVRRSQMFMASQAQVAQQQQQQQMMLQAQAMRQSMMFGAPSIMSGQFYPAMAPMAPMAAPMMPPPLPSTPLPVPDTVKLNRVDKWRHDVAVEGEQR